jgi:hypothetical protein
MRRADRIFAVVVLVAALAFPTPSSSEQAAGQPAAQKAPAAPANKTPAKPTTTKPPAPKPVTAKPTTAKPATAKPATSKPATTKPPAATSTAAKPIAPKPVVVAPEPLTAATMSREQMRDFLLTAEVVSFKEIGKGITKPKRLTLTKNGITHDGAFQSVDDRRLTHKVGNVTELNFVDAYRYNLAAYELASLVGLEHMMPVHVERKWDGDTGSLSWWADVLMDEGDRQKKKIEPPNSMDWNAQMFRMRVFAALIRDTDRNQGNILITPAWKVMMIDFTRAFRPQTKIENPNVLLRVDKELLNRMTLLTEDGIKAAVGKHLTDEEIEAVIERRDNLVTHFRDLVAKRGEKAVLY